MTERRRADGVEAQADRNKNADFKRLAVELDCHVRTIWRQHKAGTLDAYVEKRRANVRKVSPR
ncbi:hypothetical protein CTI14_00635 [Methylobacterium radiotolerans]|nr:hypothetical protein CTI14_00635 [Methylobacterium radiotolerans]